MKGGKVFATFVDPKVDQRVYFLNSNDQSEDIFLCPKKINPKGQSFPSNECFLYTPSVFIDIYAYRINFALMQFTLLCMKYVIFKIFSNIIFNNHLSDSGREIFTV